MISFQPNTIEETEFRSHQFLLQSMRPHVHRNYAARRFQDDDFTKSCVFQSENRSQRNHNMVGHTHEDFFSSVHVVPIGKGQYTVYQPHIKYAESHTGEHSLPNSSNYSHSDGLRNSASANQIITGDGSRTDSVTGYQHHIRNLSQVKASSKQFLTSGQGEEGISLTASLDEGLMRKTRNTEKYDGKKEKGRMKTGKKTQRPNCCCKSYHCHTFPKPDFCRMSSINVEFEASLAQMRTDLVEANEKHLIICNTFWRPFLSMSEFREGKEIVKFDSLWLEEVSLKGLLRDSIQNTILRSAISELTMMAVAVSPLQLLKSLIDLSLVRVDSLLENGAGLLHHGCVFRRSEVVQYLVREGVSPTLKDRQGNSADQYCFSSEVRRLLPTKYQAPSVSGLVAGGRGTGGRGTGGWGRGHLLQPSVQDKDVIFRMAESAGSLMELQKRLQMFEFNVNTECNGHGDFLVHIAVQGGLCQLPLLMLLIRIQQADIELCNSKGMTPLMIAAQDGDAILCEVLICIFGASPNKCNVHSGKTALHFAAQYNHVDIVSCLMRRGSDFNKEDHSGMRPDDPWMWGYGEDCLNLISVHRTQRSQHLSQLNKEGKLRAQDLKASDIGVVDTDGFTLLMVAALHNRVDSMKIILDFDPGEVKTSLNAQYYQTSESHEEGIVTGMTALAMASYKGHTLCVGMLLLRGANPVIGDMQSYLPLHHAVLHGHEGVVDTILGFFPDTYRGLHRACTMNTSPSLDKKLRDAWKRRQDEVVMTELMSCAMSGRAEELYRLLEEGDNINSQTGVGTYPLYLAAENGHLSVVKLLCERGVDARKRHLPTGSTVLHAAARMGKLEVVEYLLQFTTSSSGSELTCGRSHRQLDINAVNVENKTALQMAGEKGYLKIVKILLASGATTALLDPNGILFSLPEYGGVFNEVELRRNKHTDAVMKLIRDKSKKRVQELIKIWVPRFDHNLRNRNADTPLMVACYLGRADVVNFLLKSAFYPQDDGDVDSGSDLESEADSGVMDTATVVSGTTKLEDSGDSTDNKKDVSLLRRSSGSESGDPSTGQWGQTSIDGSHPPSRLESLLSDVEKPKGLAIYHGGHVSHVCAVNLYDASTPLHRCIEGGDNSVIAESLLCTDAMCVNSQNSSGLTPLHLACKMVRKKCLDKLLAVQGLDINLLTLNGHLAEEMTTNKTVIKMVQKARKGHPVREKSLSGAPVLSPPSSSSLSEAAPYHKPPSTTGSTISLEKVHQRFEQLKHSHQLKQNKESGKK